MKRKIFALATAAAAALAAANAQAATLTEDFEAPFPAWESNWFGANSNAENCYGAGQGRGNNPDGLWIATTGQGCSASPVTVLFNSGFAAGLSSFDFDVAGYATSVLTIFDKDGATLLSTPLALTFGAFGDPGTYAHYGVTSSNGIGGFSFTGAASGNTSIDNIAVTFGNAVGNAVPEPATWGMMILGFGTAGMAMRRRRKVSVSFA